MLQAPTPMGTLENQHENPGDKAHARSEKHDRKRDVRSVRVDFELNLTPLRLGRFRAGGIHLVGSKVTTGAENGCSLKASS